MQAMVNLEPVPMKMIKSEQLVPLHLAVSAIPFPPIIKDTIRILTITHIPIHTHITIHITIQEPIIIPTPEQIRNF